MIWAAFQENLNSIATCDFKVQLCGSRFDPKFVTNQHWYRRSGDLIRWDLLSRTQRQEGVAGEHLAQLFFDGSRTIQTAVTLPGLEREFSPLQPRGIRCQISPGLDQRLSDALVIEVLDLRAYAVGGAPSFAEVPAKATSVSVTDNTKPTIRYVLPDFKRGDTVHKEQYVEFEFDRARGWWITQARFGTTPSTGPPRSGEIRIKEFHDLGNGRFFPKILERYSRNADGQQKLGPVTRVTQCQINEAVDESELVLETPLGLPISVEAHVDGHLRINKLQVYSAAGERNEFAEHDRFAEFAHLVDGQHEWTGSYTPPGYFDYYYKDKQQARSLLQRAMNSPNLSPIRSRKTVEENGITGGVVGSLVCPTRFSIYLGWGGLAVLAVVAFWIVQWVFRKRLRAQQGRVSHAGGNVES
jgi:hypothetical protein